MLSSDDEDETRDNDVYVTDKASRELGPLEEETASSKYVCLMAYQTLCCAGFETGLSCICRHLTFFEAFTYSVPSSNKYDIPCCMIVK